MEADHLCIVVSRRPLYQVFAFSCLQKRILSVEESLSTDFKIQPGDWIIVKSLTNSIINEYQQTNSQYEAYATFDGTVRLNLSVVFPSLESGGASRHGWGWSSKIGWIQCAEGVERWMHVGGKSVFSVWVEWKEKYQSWFIEPQKLIEDRRTSYQKLIKNAPWRVDKATIQHVSTNGELYISSNNVSSIERLHWRECTDEEEWLSTQKPNLLFKECKSDMENNSLYPYLETTAFRSIEWHRAIIMDEYFGNFVVHTERGSAVLSETTQDISPESHLPISSAVMCDDKTKIEVNFYKVVEPFFETNLTLISGRLELRVFCEVLFFGEQETLGDELISFGTNEFFGRCYIYDTLNNTEVENSFRGRLHAVICMTRHPVILTRSIFKILNFSIIERFHPDSKPDRTSIGFIFIELPYLYIWSKDFDHDIILPKKYLRSEIRESWLGRWVRFSSRKVGCNHEVCLTIEVVECPPYPVRIKSGTPELKVRCVYNGERDAKQRAVLFCPGLGQLIYDRDSIIHTSEYGKYDLWVVRENRRTRSWKISYFEFESTPIFHFSSKSENDNCDTVTLEELSVAIQTVLQSLDVQDSLSYIDPLLLSDLTKMI